ncbi:hypothetical protein EVAR_18749_1 [Eumeta japonica]|uniref:Uncharacterized protein n=1 Tax=Eumeta variegata TaxID=151549 RepID=A0A4C1UM97_EUMVA|nr:hypothetical protein EVAR_18749_1 [Eumeta japonica]
MSGLASNFRPLITAVPISAGFDRALPLLSLLLQQRRESENPYIALSPHLECAARRSDAPPLAPARHGAADARSGAAGAAAAACSGWRVAARYGSTRRAALLKFRFR